MVVLETDFLIYRFTPFLISRSTFPETKPCNQPAISALGFIK